MEDNFKHRQDLVKPDENLSNSNKEYLSEDDRPNKHSGIGPRTKDGKHGVLLIFLVLWSMLSLKQGVGAIK